MIDHSDTNPDEIDGKSEEIILSQNFINDNFSDELVEVFLNLSKIAHLKKYKEIETIDWLNAIFLSKDSNAFKILNSINSEIGSNVNFSTSELSLLNDFHQDFHLIRHNAWFYHLLDYIIEELKVLKRLDLDIKRISSDLLLIALTKNYNMLSSIELKKYGVTYKTVKEKVYINLGLSPKLVFPIHNDSSIFYLYKYLPNTPIAKKIFENIIINNKIKYTPPIQLNDKFELLSKIDTFASTEDIVKIFSDPSLYERKEFSEAFHEQSKNTESLISYDEFKVMAYNTLQPYHETISDFLANTLNSTPLKLILENTFNTLISQTINVLSLSSRIDSMPMWAHYASNFTGYVIEFDMQNPYLFSDDSNNCAKPVMYFNKLESVDNLYLRTVQGYDYFTNLLALQKTTDWSYEYEWRKVKSFTELEIDENGILLDTFPVEAITKIIFGCDTDYDFKLFAKKTIDSESTCKHIELFDSKFNSETQTLDLIPFIA